MPEISFVWPGSEKHETWNRHTGVAVTLSADSMSFRKGEW